MEEYQVVYILSNCIELSGLIIEEAYKNGFSWPGKNGIDSDKLNGKVFQLDRQTMGIRYGDEADLASFHTPIISFASLYSQRFKDWAKSGPNNKVKDGV